MVYDTITRSIISFEKDYEGFLVKIENDNFLFRLTPKGFNKFVEMYSEHFYPKKEQHNYPQNEYEEERSEKYDIYFQGGYVYLLVDFETVDNSFLSYDGQELIVYFMEDKGDVE